jgi:hypothetical protein
VTDLDASPIPMTIIDCAAEITRLRRALLHHTELTGAAVAVLTAIHRAGGWHVVDPIHHDRMRAALDALESAVEATLNERGGR